MLYGLDVSHWNYVARVKNIIDYEETDFIFIKVSEGATWRDGKAEEFAYMAATSNVEVGFYHYCRPDNGNSPKEEALNFFNAVNQIMEKNFRLKNVGIAIDWEGKSLEWPRWLDEFVYECTELFKVNPILYCSQSQLKTVGQYINSERVGLWCAEWNDSASLVSDYRPWNVCAFHQYTNEPYDKDVFFGDKEQLAKYFAYTRQEPESDCTCTCSCCADKKA